MHRISVGVLSPCGFKMTLWFIILFKIQSGKLLWNNENVKSNQYKAD